MSQILSDKAYCAIKKMIKDGKYTPGMALPEQELTQILGMSRTPIREALHRLQEEMLVDIKPRLGAVVATLDLSQLCNLYETREAIEGMVARLNCRKTNDTAPYQKLVDEYHRISKIPDADRRRLEFDEVNEKYVEILSQGCRNPMLSKMFLSIQDKVHSLHRVAHLIPIFPDIGAEERSRVIEAIVEKDEQKAEDLARYRIRCCLKRILDEAMPH